MELALYRQTDSLLAQAEELNVHLPMQTRRLLMSTGKTPLSQFDPKVCTKEVADFLLVLFANVLSIAGKPTAVDGSIFQQTVTTRFPAFTISDLKEAFDFFVFGDLDSRIPKNHKHYQRFSKEFYVPILKAYQQMQREATHDTNGKVGVLLLEAKKDPPGLARAKYYRLLADLVRAWCVDGKDQFMVDDKLVHVMRRCRLLQTMPEPTQGDKERALLMVQRGKAWSIQKLIHRQFQTGVDNEDINGRALRYAVRRQLLEELTAQGPDMVCKRLEWMAENALNTPPNGTTTKGHEGGPGTPEEEPAATPGAPEGEGQEGTEGNGPGGGVPGGGEA